MKTSEGFETSSGFLLWGSYDYRTPLLISKPSNVIVRRTQEENKDSKEEKFDEFIDEVTYGNVKRELELGDEFVDE